MGGNLIRKGLTNPPVASLRVEKEAEVMYKLIPKTMAYFTVDGKTPDGHLQLGFHVCNLFSEEETALIRSAVFVLNRYSTNLNRLDGVRDAYHEFKDELKNLDSNSPQSKSTVDRRFRAFILEWKLFLDHFDRYIKDGAQTGYWKDASETEKKQYLDAFRRYFEDVKDPRCQSDKFNLAAVIRNHIQHANNAIDRTDWQRIYINRDKLLGDDRVNASQKAALKSQPEFIDLETIADGAVEVIGEIHEQLLNFMVDDETADAALTMLKAHNRILEAGIESDRWVICGMSEIELVDRETGKTITEIQETDQVFIPFELETGMVKNNFTIGTKMVYIPLNWPAYIAFAGLLGDLWKKGVWKNIQKKYFEEGA